MNPAFADQGVLDRPLDPLRAGGTFAETYMNPLEKWRREPGSRRHPYEQVVREALARGFTRRAS